MVNGLAARASINPMTNDRNTIHILGLPHTVPNEDYATCAFTTKVRLFPRVLQSLGWRVKEYANVGSETSAEHVEILSRKQFKLLSKRKSRTDALDADIDNKPLGETFQTRLLSTIKAMAKPGDIVGHIWGPNMEVVSALPDCIHVEMCVGYLASPGLPFRIYESSAWMHWHYGRAGQEDGNNYKWVIPSPIDTNRWTPAARPTRDYVLFYGRVTERKGLNTLVEIAKRMPREQFLAVGAGDPSLWTEQANFPANLTFKGAAFGDERACYLQNAKCMVMPTTFIEPFGNSGVEAQLCGTPLISTAYGAFQETIDDGVTGYRCHALADWTEAIEHCGDLDRTQISALAHRKYDQAETARRYDMALRQLQDLRGAGWYAETSHKFPPRSGLAA